MDPEESYSEAEINKLEHDIIEEGLSVVLFAEWYDPHLLSLSTADAKVKSHKSTSNVPLVPVTG